MSLAHYLVKCGQKVLLIDLDPQGQWATSMGMDPKQGVFYLLVIAQSSAQEVSFTKRRGCNKWSAFFRIANKGFSLPVIYFERNKSWHKAILFGCGAI
jgi:hypothetical protein